MMVWSTDIILSWLYVCCKITNSHCFFMHRASYCDGKLKAPAKPCAGNQGTLISVNRYISSNNKKYEILD